MTATVLGGIAGNIGIGKQLGAAAGLGGNRHHADAATDGKGPFLPVERKTFQHLHNAFGNPVGLVQVTLGQQNAEFVAAQARQYSVIRQQVLLLQAGCKFPEHGVAGNMADGFIDDLELVDIQVTEYGVAVVVTCFQQCLLQAGLEFIAVEQAGEMVMRGLVLDVTVTAREALHQLVEVSRQQADFIPAFEQSLRQLGPVIAGFGHDVGQVLDR